MDRKAVSLRKILAAGRGRKSGVHGERKAVAEPNIFEEKSVLISSRTFICYPKEQVSRLHQKNNKLTAWELVCE